MSGDRPNVRKERAQFSRAKAADRLPPHSTEAEQGVLGCCIIQSSLVGKVFERLPKMEVFYENRHQVLWTAILALHEKIPGGWDAIVLMEKLREWGKVDECGGWEYVMGLQDEVASPANVQAYVDIVWEKWLGRRMVQQGAEITESVYDHNGPTEALLAKIQRQREEFDRDAQRGTLTPRYLRPMNDFAEDAFHQLFREPSLGEPGLELPIKFPFKIRRKEATLVSGDDKSGKSTLLSYFALHLAAADPGICVASFEEPPAISLWRLAATLLGKKHLPDTDDGRRAGAGAMAWLGKRFWAYDFLGISDWRDVLDTFRYAREKHGVWCFILDSVMRIGIGDDDYAQQGFAAAAFAQFAMANDAHLFFVIHENKGEKGGKGKIRGSKLWSANANNILQVERNLDKGEKASKLEWEIKVEKQQSRPDVEDIKEKEAKLEFLRKEWDCHMVLRGQRWLGSNQNASKRFWFDRDSFQFRDHWEDPAVNWFERWRKKKDEPSAAKGGKDAWGEAS